MVVGFAGDVCLLGSVFFAKSSRVDSFVPRRSFIRSIVRMEDFAEQLKRLKDRVRERDEQHCAEEASLQSTLTELGQQVTRISKESRQLVETVQELGRDVLQVRRQGDEHVLWTGSESKRKDQMIAQLNAKVEKLELAADQRDARIEELEGALEEGKSKFEEEAEDNLRDKQRIERLLQQLQIEVRDMKEFNGNISIGGRNDFASVPGGVGMREREGVERAKQAVLGVKLRFTGDVRISHPMQFLRTFEKITGRIGLSGEQRMIVLGEACLTGGALTWFLESDLSDYEHFDREFKGKFWTSKEHNRLMDEVNSNILMLEKGELLSDYVSRIVREVSYLPYRMEDNYLAKRLIRKFNEELRNLLLTTVTSTEQLKTTLSTLENEDSQILKGRKVTTAAGNHPGQNTWGPREDWRTGPYRNQSYGNRMPGAGIPPPNHMQGYQGGPDRQRFLGPPGNQRPMDGSKTQGTGNVRSNEPTKN